jgi:hypothetical protein
MIARENIEKFNKIIEYYHIDKKEMLDIAKAISFAESFGTHPIRLKDLVVSGVEYYADITSEKKDAKPLPDTRVLRLMCDSLTIYLLLAKNSLFSNPSYLKILTEFSVNTSRVLKQASALKGTKAMKSANVDYYKTVEECEGILDTYYSAVAKQTEANDTIAKFIKFIEADWSVGVKLDGLVLPSQYKVYFEKTSFYNMLNFTDRKSDDTLLDCITNYLIDCIVRHRARLQLCLMMTTKGRNMKLDKKYVLKVSTDKYRNITADTLILNALGSVFTFTHASSVQNVESVIILYALINFNTQEVNKVKNFL